MTSALAQPHQEIRPEDKIITGVPVVFKVFLRAFEDIDAIIYSPTVLERAARYSVWLNEQTIQS